MLRGLFIVLLLFILTLFQQAHGSDWPAWRGDAGRTASCSQDISKELFLHWGVKLPALRPAWPDAKRLRFDNYYRPVIFAGMLLTASSHADSVTARDMETGKVKWRFYAGGPVRFAPYCYQGRVYFCSDDGWLYCLKASDGKLIWRYPGSPDCRRKVIGNERIISTWPARGGPVVADGTVYFAAGIWPFMGVFVHAVDARSGKRIWCNSGSGSIFMDQPHNSPAFAGLAPQGYLVISGDRLLVPNGRAVAAGLRRSDGKLLYFHHSSNGHNGKYFAAARGKHFYNSYSIFKLFNGAPLERLMSTPVLGSKAIYFVDGNRSGSGLLSWSYKNDQGLGRYGLRGSSPGRIILKAGDNLCVSSGNDLLVLQAPVTGRGPAKIIWRKRIAGRIASVLAGDGRLVVATFEGSISCFGPGKKDATKVSGAVTAQNKVDNQPGNLAGSLNDLLPKYSRKGGWCLIKIDDSATGKWLVKIAASTGMRVVGISSEASLVSRLRKELYVSQNQAARDICLLNVQADATGLPKYFSPLILWNASQGSQTSSREIVECFRMLRPYGGRALFSRPLAEIKKMVAAAGLQGFEISTAGKYTSLIRKGPLKGAGSWTHQYGNSANTVVSEDDLVRSPLGLLWFGGPSNSKVLPRHGHGPNPQVAGGRLIIEGPDMLRAIDVYTGRLLWEKELPGVGKFYDNTAHQPGANSIGSNYVTLAEDIYVLHEGKCLRLDAANGREISKFTFPQGAAKIQKKIVWSFLAVAGDVLIGGGGPQDLFAPEFSPDELKSAVRDLEDLKGIIEIISKIKAGLPAARKAEERDANFLARNLNILIGQRDLIARVPANPKGGDDGIAQRLRVYLKRHPRAGAADVTLKEMNRQFLQQYCRQLPRKLRATRGGWSWNGVSSQVLAAFDRKTGKLLWRLKARAAFLHNAICAGGNRLYCMDRYPTHIVRHRRFVGKPTSDGRIQAFNIKTGQLLWKRTEGVFGSWLSYSVARDLLVQATRPSRDHLKEYNQRISVLKAADGREVWNRSVDYKGPVLINGDRIITQDRALNLLTGASLYFKDPLTGQPDLWRFGRNYGCNTAVGSRHLLTFRSAAAGYFDIQNMGGTANLGGFKSGCSSNLLVADGVIAAADYTRTCNCSYQNQSSIGLIHDPQVEHWTFNRSTWNQKVVRRIGLNFGAPGDRKSQAGTLWLDFPSGGSRSPDIPVSVSPLYPLAKDVVPPRVFGRTKGYSNRGNGSVIRPAIFPRTFRMHFREMSGSGLKWVGASGLSDVKEISLDLGQGAWRKYTVKLYFSEPDNVAIGQRIFDVRLQGKTIIKVLDVLSAAGGKRRLLVKEFKGVAAKQFLKLSFKPKGKLPAIISGLEVLLETP
jgi:outer membrane protein assembly factor BamB